MKHRSPTPGRVAADALALGLVAAVFGLSFGALAVDAGTAAPVAVLASAIVFAPGSQLAAAGIAGAGGSAWLGVLTGLLINARHGVLALGAVGVAGRGALRRALTAHFVVEGSVLAAANQDGVRAARRAFWLTGGIIFAFHLAGTALGTGLGAVVTDLDAIGMDAALPAAFVGLLAPSVRRRPQLAAALAGAAIATVSLFFVPASVAVLVAAAGAGVGLVTSRRGGTGP